MFTLPIALVVFGSNFEKGLTETVNSQQIFVSLISVSPSFARRIDYGTLQRDKEKVMSKLMNKTLYIPTNVFVRLTKSYKPFLVELKMTNTAISHTQVIFASSPVIVFQ